MGYRGAQIRKNARERQAVILRRHFGHILHCRENSDADCAEKKEQEVLSGGQTKLAIVDRKKQSRNLKYGPHRSAPARNHDNLMSRAPIFPSLKHNHAVSPLSREFPQSSQEKSISFFAESTVVSQSDDDDSKTCENDEEKFPESDRIENRS
jgi:hypothetical protein